MPFIDPAWMFGTRVMSWAKILPNVFSSSCKPWAHTKTKLSTFLNLETIPIDTTKELKQVANLSPAWSAQALFCSLVMLIDRGPSKLYNFSKLLFAESDWIDPSRTKLILYKFSGPACTTESTASSFDVLWCICLNDVFFWAIIAIKVPFLKFLQLENTIFQKKNFYFVNFLNFNEIFCTHFVDHGSKTHLTCSNLI